MYKRLRENSITGEPVPIVHRVTDNAFIPFDLENEEYRRFKNDIANDVPLQVHDGRYMTSEEIEQYLKTLP